MDIIIKTNYPYFYTNNFYMKVIKFNSLIESIISILIVFFVVVFLSSCSKKIVFTTSSIVPAAQGKVKIKKDKNKNYDVEVNINHLAEPKRLSPPRETYVVWIETQSNGTKNIGQMNSSSGFLSSKLKASLHAVTPFKPTRVFVTAEDNGNIQFPGMEVVLRTETF